MNEHVGTVTDPLWNEILTALFIGIGLVLLVVAAASLIVRWREMTAERRQPPLPVVRPLPFAMQVDWIFGDLTADDTPIGDQLFREYAGGVSR